MMLKRKGRWKGGQYEVLIKRGGSIREGIMM